MRAFGRWQQKRSSSLANLEKRRGGRCWNLSFEKTRLASGLPTLG
ncbi:hypothetical protein C351_03886 [Cryptococcus neoformans c8]|nr:hypothetical protein C353_04010 [Cryptococcus neoformans var. grubii AD1-83a]OXG61260.1 hypothetical protein C352_03957 [Cryptococcus neoformans var. grubii CHC193]OXG62168.1 hypothetical protein C351_03886 [Cryptococcus neoformans var. grubii c8]